MTFSQQALLLFFAMLLSLALIGALIAFFLARRLLKRPPERWVRQNYREQPVPAVLGLPVVAGGLVSAVVVTVWPKTSAGPALVLVLVALALAGLFDDLRGRELPRGFSGHLAAARSGRLTGGLVKLVAGGLAGLAAGALVTSGIDLVLVALLVALSANLVNLLDRRPGRASKATFLLALPLLVFGHVGWVIAAAGLLGGLTAVFPLDLAEKGMLGDAGANPVGGAIGLGLALSLPAGVAWVTAGLLLALNLASERWSFSQVIADNRVLRTLDELGRK